MAATRQRKIVTISNHKTKGRTGEGMTRALDNVEDVIDTVSFRLWELTR